MALLLLGYDVGSSSVKAALMDGGTGKAIARRTSSDRGDGISPRTRLGRTAPRPWWEHIARDRKIRDQVRFDPGDVQGHRHLLPDARLVVRGQEREGAAAVDHLVRQPGGADRREGRRRRSGPRSASTAC